MIVVAFLAYGTLNYLERLRLNYRKYGTIQRCLGNYVELLGLLLGQGSAILIAYPDNLPRNPLILWLFFAFLIRVLFANDITAILLSRGDFHFDAFDQLKTAPQNLKILIVSRSSSQFYLNLRFPELTQRTEEIPFEEANSVDSLKKVLAGRHVLVTPREHGEIIRAYYHTVHFHVSKEGFYSSLGNFAMRKDLEPESTRKLGKLYAFPNFKNDALS
jgi:hypothetical protein